MESSVQPQNQIHQSQQQQYLPDQDASQRLDNCLQTSHQVLDNLQQSSLHLQNQGETLNRVDQNLDIMSDNLKKGDYIATGMTTWGYIKNLFKKVNPNKPKKIDSSQNANALPSQQQLNQEQQKNGKNLMQEQIQMNGIQSQNSTNNRNQGFEEQKEPNVDSKLDDLLKNIRGMKAVNQTIGTEITRQNHQLDQINTKTQKVEDQTIKLNKKVEKLLR
eukprot:403358445